MKFLFPKAFGRISKSATVFCLALVSLTVFSALPAAASGLLGIRYNGSITDLRNEESWQGRKNGVVMFFTNFCSTSMSSAFNSALTIWNNHNVPIISWQPYTCSGTSSTIEEQIASGKYDSFIYTWAGKLKTFLAGPDGVFGTADDRRVYIRFAHEMNGTWYPWSATAWGETPSGYINMWRHVHSILESKGLNVSHVQWIWCVNAHDNGKYTAEQYYPGSSYVDWIGIDGYNFGDYLGKWISPSDRFGNMVYRMRKMAAKPISFPETGSTAKYSGSINIWAKSQWVSSLFSYVVNNNIKMVVYFNHDTTILSPCCPTIDWTIFSGKYGDKRVSINSTYYKVYTAYRNGAGSWYFVSPSGSNLRLITDSVFEGQ